MAIDPKQLYQYLMDTELIKEIEKNLYIRKVVTDTYKYSAGGDAHDPLPFSNQKVIYETTYYYKGYEIKQVECSETIDGYDGEYNHNYKKAGDIITSGYARFNYDKVFSNKSYYNDESIFLDKNLIESIIKQYNITNEIIEKHIYGEDYEDIVEMRKIESDIKSCNNNISYYKNIYDKEIRKSKMINGVLKAYQEDTYETGNSFYTFIKETGLIDDILKHIIKNVFPSEYEVTTIDKQGKIAADFLYIYKNNNKNTVCEKAEITFPISDYHKYNHRKSLLCNEIILADEKENPFIPTLFNNDEFINQIKEDYFITDEVLNKYFNRNIDYFIDKANEQISIIESLKHEVEFINGEIKNKDDQIKDFEERINKKK